LFKTFFLPQYWIPPDSAGFLEFGRAASILAQALAVRSNLFGHDGTSAGTVNPGPPITTRPAYLPSVSNPTQIYGRSVWQRRMAEAYGRSVLVFGNCQ
jgi:hypothetical protein